MSLTVYKKVSAHDRVMRLVVVMFVCVEEGGLGGLRGGGAESVGEDGR